MAGPPVPFSKLPLNQDVPDTKLNAWGAYGNDDEKGFLNRQTDELVKMAADSEIKTGKRYAKSPNRPAVIAIVDVGPCVIPSSYPRSFHVLLSPQQTLFPAQQLTSTLCACRISLNAPLDYQRDKPFFGRQAFHKDVYQKGNRFVNDDTWSFNTQSSSQWDGFRHFGYQKAGRFYNNTTMDDIHKAQNRPENFLGIHNFAEQGIVGRGILVDFARWRERQTSNEELAEFECFKATPIKLEWIKQILQEQGTEVRFGDILIVRSGFMAAYLKLSPSDIQSLIESNPPPVCGVEQSEGCLQCESIGRLRVVWLVCLTY